MLAVLSREQMRAFDADAIQRCHVSGLVLMENAGRGAAERLQGLAPGSPWHAPGAVVVVCGTGNNGGDGLVVARELLARNLAPVVLVVGEEDKFSAEACVQYDAYRALGGQVTCAGAEAALAALEKCSASAALIVDALFGTGLTRSLSAPLIALIEAINQAPAVRVALDIPSGLEANTGQIMGACVAARHTFTFAAPKLGMLTTQGADYVGELHIVPLGVPAPSLEAGLSARVLERTDVARLLLPRRQSAHKGSVGRVAVVAGSPGKIGAALLSARGALRSGAALVTLVGLPETAQVFAQRVTEEMVATLSPTDIEASLRDILSGMDAVVVGPGLGLDEEASRIVEAILAEFPGKVVVDADALTLLAGRLPDCRRARGQLVLTPHPGEMGRLLGIDAADVENDRFLAVARAVELSGHVVLLKGPHTIIGAPNQHPFVNTVAAPVLATGGSGDVLSGVIAALLLSLESFEAAACGAFLHGASGLCWQKSMGADRGMLAREIADGIPHALAGLSAPDELLPL